MNPITTVTAVFEMVGGQGSRLVKRCKPVIKQEVHMQPRMSMITLGVRDLEASIQFYEQGLGFPRMESPPSVAFFPLNGTWLGLFGREDLAEDARVPAGGSGFPGFSISHNVTTEAEVDRLLARAVAAGARLTKPGQKVFWGGYCGYFQDPDGFLWEIAHNPHFWVGPPETGEP